MPLKVTLTRHGESTDNLLATWAGYKNAPLSNHGQNQAKLVGQAFAKEKIDALYSSDLLRAHWTGLQIYNHHGLASDEFAAEETAADGNEASEPPVLRSTSSGLAQPKTTPLLREQNFGAAEGLPWDEGKYADTRILFERDYTFPEGETLNDVSKRVNKFVDRVIRPWLLLSKDEDHHIVITSHGIAIAELTSALQILDPDNPNNFYGSLQNTSYHQLRLKPTSSFAPTSEQVSSAKSSIGADIPEQTFLPDLEIPVKVELIRSGVVDHLKSLHRHTAYVKSAEEKAKTAEKEKFFGGGGANKTQEGKL